MSIPGYFLYKNITILQNENIFDPFTKLIKTYKPQRILEIGTASGGLSLLLRDLLNVNGCKDTTLRTYDIVSGDWSRSDVFIEAIKTCNIESFLKNIFTPDYSALQDITCADYIQSKGTTLVLCDGGNKTSEFNILSKYLKTGDIIMAHDYAYSREIFNEQICNKFWNYCEIIEADIDAAVKQYNLFDTLCEEFAHVGWCCKIKK
jgi:hypothetical protein